MGGSDAGPVAGDPESQRDKKNMIGEGAKSRNDRANSSGDRANSSDDRANSSDDSANSSGDQKEYDFSAEPAFVIRYLL